MKSIKDIVNKQLAWLAKTSEYRMLQRSEISLLKVCSEIERSGLLEEELPVEKFDPKLLMKIAKSDK